MSIVYDRVKGAPDIEGYSIVLGVLLWVFCPGWDCMVFEALRGLERVSDTILQQGYSLICCATRATFNRRFFFDIIVATFPGGTLSIGVQVGR